MARIKTLSEDRPDWLELVRELHEDIKNGQGKKESARDIIYNDPSPIHSAPWIYHVRANLRIASIASIARFHRARAGTAILRHCFSSFAAPRANLPQDHRADRRTRRPATRIAFRTCLSDPARVPPSETRYTNPSRPPRLRAPRVLRSGGSGKDLFGDLLRLTSAVHSDDFDLDRIKPLLNVALADHLENAHLGPSSP